MENGAKHKITSLDATNKTKQYKNKLHKLESNIIEFKKLQPIDIEHIEIIPYDDDYEDPKKKQSKKIMITLNEEEYQKLLEKALDLGLPPSTMAALLIRKELKQPS